MALEKRWSAVAPISFTADGTSQGLISLTTTRGLKVKQIIAIQSSSKSKKLVQIQKVISPTQIVVSEPKGKLTDTLDISDFLLIDGAFLFAEEQARPAIPITEHERAVYEEEPTVAKRVFGVDKFGNPWDLDNPFPVSIDGEINIGEVNAQVDVNLTHLDNFPDPGDIADSVRIGDGTDVLSVNPDGSINVVSSESAAKNPVITNVVINNADTEESFSFPAGTKRFSLKVRDGKSKLRLAFNSGESGTNFISIEMGQRYLEESVTLDTGLIVYFQTVKPNQVVEILYWT